MSSVPNDLQRTCNDLRVVYQPSSTQAVELPRSISLASGASDCSNSNSTIVSFPLQAALTNGSSDANYYVYYSNHIATAPANSLSAFDTTPGAASFVAPFNGTTTAQASGSGTPTTATGAIRYSGGKGAIQLDGFSDYIDAGNGVSLNGLTNGSFTIEGWFKIQNSGNNSLYDLFNKDYSSANDWWAFGSFSSRNIQFGAKFSNTNLTISSSNNAYTFNSWFHLAIVYDKTSNHLHSSNLY